MLQQIRDKISGWFATFFLGAIAVVFVFWGIRFESTVNKAAVTINGESIPLVEVRKAWQERQTQLQQQLKAELPAALVKGEQQKILEDFIAREVLVQRAHEMGYRVSDKDLADEIYAIPALQVDGKFSRDRYAMLLRQQGRSEPEFERDFRRDLETGQLRNGIGISAFATEGELRRRLALEGETRDVVYAVLPVASFTAQVVVKPEALAAWYEQHKADFKTPEMVSLQYLSLSLADIGAKVQVNEDTLHKYYDQVAAERFVDPERRHASHILIESGKDDAAAAKKAEQIAARAKAGEDFAKLARENSDDPGSKQAGGDLGWATREAYVKPFAEAVFAMQKGEVRGPVKTQFGYHIIRLDGVEPVHQRPFEEVRAQVEADYRKEQAQNAFYEKSQQLADESFAALSELDSVGKKLGLPVQTVEGFTREGGGPLGADRKIIEAAFSPEVLEQRQNSPAINVGDDRVVVLRVTDHKAAQQRPLDQVHDQVEASVRLELARKAALAAAEAAAAKVASGQAVAVVAAAAGVKPVNSPGLGRRAGADGSVPPELVKAAFQAARPTPGKDTAGTAVLANGDAAVFSVSGVHPGTLPATGEEQVKELRARLVQTAQQRAAQAEFLAYANELQATAKIKRNPNVFASE